MATNDPPFCDCTHCDDSRRRFGLVLAQCGLFPAAHADYLAAVYGRTRKMLRAVCEAEAARYTAETGRSIEELAGVNDVVLAALALPLVDKPDTLERLRPLVEKLLTLQRQELSGGKGAN